MPTQIFLLGIVSSVLPDADVITFSYGIPYEHMYGHRGFTHSIFFAVIWSMILLLIFHRSSTSKAIIALYYFICTASHGVLDAMTTGGRGVAFFAPFSEERYFLPWRFIHVSPLGASNFFSEWGLRVIRNEFYYVGIPFLLVILVGIALNKWLYH